MAATAVVFTAKVADDLPAGTVTLASTVAAELLLDSFTVIPPVGAAPLRLTVPVEDVPPVTELGLSVTAVSDGGMRVRAVVTVTPFQVPDRVADFWADTPVVFTKKVVEV